MQLFDEPGHALIISLLQDRGGSFIVSRLATDAGGVHSVYHFFDIHERVVVLVRQYQYCKVLQFFLCKHLIQLDADSLDPFDVAAIHHKDQSNNVLVVVSPH